MKRKNNKTNNSAQKKRTSDATKSTVSARNSGVIKFTTITDAAMAVPPVVSANIETAVLSNPVIANDVPHLTSLNNYVKPMDQSPMNAIPTGAFYNAVTALRKEVKKRPVLYHHTVNSWSLGGANFVLAPDDTANKVDETILSALLTRLTLLRTTFFSDLNFFKPVSGDAVNALDRDLKNAINILSLAAFSFQNRAKTIEEQYELSKFISIRGGDNSVHAASYITLWSGNTVKQSRINAINAMNKIPVSFALRDALNFVMKKEIISYSQTGMLMTFKHKPVPTTGWKLNLLEPPDMAALLTILDKSDAPIAIKTKDDLVTAYQAINTDAQLVVNLMFEYMAVINKMSENGLLKLYSMSDWFLGTFIDAPVFQEKGIINILNAPKVGVAFSNDFYESETVYYPYGVVPQTASSLKILYTKVINSKAEFQPLADTYHNEGNYFSEDGVSKWRVSYTSPTLTEDGKTNILVTDVPDEANRLQPFFYFYDEAVAGLARERFFVKPRNVVFRVPVKFQSPVPILVNTALEAL